MDGPSSREVARDLLVAFLNNGGLLKNGHPEVPGEPGVWLAQTFEAVRSGIEQAP
jgi:hypothetical protein